MKKSNNRNEVNRLILQIKGDWYRDERNRYESIWTNMQR